MDEIVELSDAQYLMNMSIGGDTWALYGCVVGHPNFPNGSYVFVSTPKSFDEQTGMLVTMSGRKYHIISYASAKEEVVKQIKNDIAKCGYEVH